MAATFVSISPKLIRTPRIFMNSLERPFIHRYPSSSRQARSPLLSQPSPNFHSVASGSSKYPEQTDGPRTWISPVSPPRGSPPSPSPLHLLTSPLTTLSLP